MKVGLKELKFIPVRAGSGRPATVRIVMQAFGLQLAQEEAAPHECRQLARELIAAADAAEGLGVGQQ